MTVIPKRSTRILHLACLLAMAGTVAASAQTTRVGFLDVSEPGCWSREYSAAHMTKHPKQKVTSIVFTYAPVIDYPNADSQQQWNDEGNKAHLQATVSVTLKGSEELMMGVLVCEGGKAESLACYTIGGGLDPSATGITVKLDEGDLQIVNRKGFDVNPMIDRHDIDFESTVTIDPRDDHDVFALGGVDPGAEGNRCNTLWPYPVGN